MAQTAFTSLAIEWLRRRWFPAAFVLLLAANLLPLTAKYLPLSDLAGHMGVAAHLARFGDPASRLHELMVANPHPLYHSMLFEYLGGLAGRVMPIALYTNLFLAAFYVAALPLSLLLLLRAYRRDPRLVLLIFPFIYIAAVWMGFVNYLAAVPLALLSLALVRRMLDAPSLGTNLLLLLSASALVLAHFFIALTFFGLCALVLVLDLPPPLVAARILVTWLPGLQCIRRWQSARDFTEQGHILDILRGPRDYGRLWHLFYLWTLRGIMDDARWNYVLIAMVLSMAAALLWGIAFRAPLPADRHVLRAVLLRVQPLALLLVTTVMLFRLPHVVAGWWATNVRLIPLVAAFAILAIPPARRPTPALLLAPAMVAGLAWGLYIARDFHRFNRVEMAGADPTVDAIPQGRLVLSLWPGRETDTHYMQFPFAYMGSLYVARRGGMATPMMDGPGSDEPVRPRLLPAAPAWGQVQLFDWNLHSQGWQYFLVKQPPPPNRPYPPPFPEDKVKLVATHGLWSAYENLAVTSPR